VDYRKTKTCPECGKWILKSSSFCSSCSQLGKRNHLYKDGNACANRTCAICGNVLHTSYAELCSKCYTSSITGNKNPNYKHGHYIREFYNSVEYKTWKIYIFEKYNWTCLFCQKRDRAHMNAHHIFPKRDHPELVYELDNGICLCKECHQATFDKEYEFVVFIEAELKLRELGES
jgi:5-methylcytosine-specific restriction endonuclease McrA